MLSKETIYNSLKEIAANNNLRGESVNMLIDQITYSLFHEQVEIINALQESNLNSAYLLNSKIRQCMNVMYSVFRGRNCRVKLNFINNTLIKKNKFDVLFTSNTFKVYADSAIEFQPSTDTGANGKNIYTLIGILAKDDLLEADYTVTENNKYYIDFELDRNILSDISEDIQVFIGSIDMSNTPQVINWVEYPVTRNFYDHIQYKEDEGGLDPIFVQTIPDFGIRVYKRGYFKVSSIVRIRGLRYTVEDDINPDEFSKIKIPGTELNMPLDASGKEIGLSIDRIVTTAPEYRKDTDIVDELIPTYTDNGLIPEIPRDESGSLLYNANFYERVQAQILSKSDINILFTEHFIERVLSAINWYDGKKDSNGNYSVSFKEGLVYIFYVPRIAGDVISNDEMDVFINKYGSYFISNNLRAQTGILNEISVDISLYISDSAELSSEISTIFNKYANKLNDPNDWDYNVLNPKQVFAEISKLPTVEYIDILQYEYQSIGSGSDHSVYNDLPNNYYIDPSDPGGIKIPTYYQFRLNITYKSSLELTQTKV